MRSKPTHADVAGSRYLALQRLARTQRTTTAELLQLYVLESFLRRLAHSRHNQTLVLKGGMLMVAFDLRRATRDVDVLARRELTTTRQRFNVWSSMSHRSQQMTEWSS